MYTIIAKTNPREIDSWLKKSMYIKKTFHHRPGIMYARLSNISAYEMEKMSKKL